jgi:glycine betaine/proline transport system substrate-binding protein
VPVTYTSLANGDIDVFLGNWMPTMEADIAPYREAGTSTRCASTSTGAKYTLATNAAGAELGIADFADIAAIADALDGRIYGIEPGNDGNRLILDMIEADAFGLGGFTSSKAPNRACWPRSRAPTAGRAGDLSSAGSRTR